MEMIVSRLFTILEQQVGVYEGILKLAKDKTNIVIQGEVTKLENLVKMEQAFVLQMGKLEQQREEVVEQIADQLEIDKEHFSISQLLQHLDHAQQTKLETYQQSLANVIDELKNSNELNAKLIQQSLEYIEFSMNVLTNASVPNNGYESKGTESPAKGTRSLFDVKL